MIKDIIDSIFKLLSLKIVSRGKYRLLSRSYREYTRREILFKHLNLSTVIDVGAHQGGFAEKIFSYGFQGNIWSFEPVSANYQILSSKARNNPQWKTFKLALGNQAGKININISQNTHSSSILNVLDSHLTAAPDSKYISKETIEVTTLDSFLKGKHLHDGRILLKIDTQGYERNVLLGGENTLKSVLAVQLEASLLPLYEDSWLLKDVITFFEERGFYLASIENGFYNKKTGQLLQIDTLFLKGDK
jgi:FkbM family methyltransferase